MAFKNSKVNICHLAFYVSIHTSYPCAACSKIVAKEINDLEIFKESHNLFIYINLASIKYHTDELHLFTNDLNCKPNIIGISENASFYWRHRFIISTQIYQKYQLNHKFLNKKVCLCFRGKKSL